MSIKRRLFIIVLLHSLVACSSFYGTQQAAPVYSGDLSAVLPKVKTANKSPIKDQETVTTIPLEDTVQKKKDLIAITPPPVMDVIPAPSTSANSPIGDVNKDISLQPSVSNAPEPAASPATIPQSTAKPPVLSNDTPQQNKPSFQPLETFAPASPSVNALLIAANKNARSGDIETATATIESAIRIEPRNPTLFYKLALLRLKQSKPTLAEDLAKKSALLANRDVQLKKHSWLLIARARELQGNLDGARQAKDTADKF